MCQRISLKLPAVATNKSATFDAESYWCLKYALPWTADPWTADPWTIGQNTWDTCWVFPAGALQELITKWMLLDQSYRTLKMQGFSRYLILTCTVQLPFHCMPTRFHYAYICVQD